MNQHGKFNPNNLDGNPKKKRYNLQDGSNIFRVLPPFGSLAKGGSIAKYWSVFWLKDSRGKPKPLPSILQYGKDKIVLTPDPMFDKYQLLVKNLEAMKAQGQDPAVIEALEKTVKGLRPDKAYHINVITPANEIGVLKLRYTAFQRLKEKLTQLSKDGIDAINVGTGVFFDFKKLKDDQGKTNYTVDVHMKTLKDQNTGRLVAEIVEAPIDAAILQRMENEASDLGSLFKIFTPEEQALAATLDVNVIDRLYARPEAAETDDGAYDAEDDEATQSTAAQAVTASATQSPAAQAIVDINNQGAQVLAAATVQTPVAQTVVAPPVTQNPTATVANPKDLTDVVGRFLRNGSV